MKISPFLTAACLLCPFLAGAEVRTFTNTDGKTIKAELVGVENEAAVLKLGSGRRAKVPLKSLSEGDQAYARSWHEENKNKVSASDVRLAIEMNTKRIKTTTSGGGGRGGRRGKSRKPVSRTSKSETTFTCTLNNFSRKTIEGIEASYIIYKRTSTRGRDGSDSTTEETTGTARVDTLGPNGSVEFTSDKVVCVDTSVKGGNGPSKSQRESIIGFVVTLSVGGKEFLKQSDPKNLLGRMAEEEERRKAREKNGN